MKTSTNHYGKATMLLVAFALLISVTGANGQASVFAGRFTLAHQVRWGQATLPAGAYSVRFSSTHSPAIVRSIDGKISVFVATARRADSEHGPSSLTIVIRGSDRIVASMNLPGSGVSLVYTPLSKAEREALAKSNQVVTVPLIAANK